MASRKSIPANLKDKLLVEANRAGMICGRSPVQIHHIDGDPAKNTEDNLIVLCLNHHDEAERGKTSKGLSSNLSSSALFEYKRRLQMGIFPRGLEPFPQNNVTADIQDVKDSNIVISAGDVILNWTHDAQGERKTQEKASSSRQEPVKHQPTIGIITALEKEFAAVKALLEDAVEFKVPGQGAGRRYLLGEIPAVDGGVHFVALALAAMGNNIAAARATLLLEHFPSIEHIIMVGIAGGVPYPEKPDEHVRLGDIVISGGGGVVQYDFNKETISETIHRHPPRPPSATLLEAVSFLEVGARFSNCPWLKYIDQTMDILRVTCPAVERDILASSSSPYETVLHPKDPKRIPEQPKIFTGTIASANRLLKNPLTRDALRDKFGVKAVEMEGSGIADATWYHEKGYLVVRGICDYCDENKNDEWQEYAAIAAAAYTRSLLESIPAKSFEYIPDIGHSKGQTSVDLEPIGMCLFCNAKITRSDLYIECTYCGSIVADLNCFNLLHKSSRCPICHKGPLVFQPEKTEIIVTGSNSMEVENVTASLLDKLLRKTGSRTRGHSLTDYFQPETNEEDKD